MVILWGLLILLGVALIVWGSETFADHFVPIRKPKFWRCPPEFGFSNRLLTADRLGNPLLQRWDNLLQRNLL